VRALGIRATRRPYEGCAPNSKQPLLSESPRPSSARALRVFLAEAAQNPSSYFVPPVKPLLGALLSDLTKTIRS